MPFEPEQDERKVAAYVGLPDGPMLTPIIVPDWLRLPPEWNGYRIHQWGLRTGWDIALDGEPPWPRAILGVIARLDTAGQPVRESHVYQLWLIQAYRPGYPLGAERRWHPDLGVNDSIVGLTEPHEWPDVLAAHRGQQLIIDRLQQDPWPRSASQHEFLHERGRRLAAYCHARGISDPMRLDRQTVAEAVGYASLQSLANACHTKGVMPDQIKAEAYHQLRAETR